MVPPNATLAKIEQSYRKLSRKYHPDKVRRQRERQRESNTAGAQTRTDHVHNDNNNNNNNHRNQDGADSQESDVAEAERMLERIRFAHDVLKDDAKRLLYHRFGITDMQDVRFLWTAPNAPGIIKSKWLLWSEMRLLLRYTGQDQSFATHQDRLAHLAANLVERIRPLVEGSLSDGDLLHAVAQECDRLKKLPLGAHVLRCVGRAYRHSGQSYLVRHSKQQQQQQQQQQYPPPPPPPMSSMPPSKQNRLLAHGSILKDRLRETFRDAKQVATAAMAGGALLLAEQAFKKRDDGKNKKGKVPPMLHYVSTDNFGGGDFDMEGGMIGHDLDSGTDSLEFDPDLDEEIRREQHQKAKDALVGVMKIEALWKVVKVCIDRTTREVCKKILTGDYFFFPLHQSSMPLPKRRTGQRQEQGKKGQRPQDDGWVGRTGKTVSYEDGLTKAASALVLIGDTMVRCSKQDTAWKE